jgi:hypothetical protein
LFVTFLFLAMRRAVQRPDRDGHPFAANDLHVPFG